MTGRPEKPRIRHEWSVAMLKCAARAVDLFDMDPTEFVAFLTKVSSNLPEFVQDASMPNAEEMALLQNHDFAIVYYNYDGDKTRKYLLNDPGNVWLSATFFLKNRDVWPRIAQGIIVRSILCRAEKYGLSHYPIFAKLREIKLGMESTGDWNRLPVENVYNERIFRNEQVKRDFLQQQQENSGKVVKQSSKKIFALSPGEGVDIQRPMYDITTPEMLKKADEYFCKHKDVMPFFTKRKFSSALTKQARNLKVELSSTSSLYGSSCVDGDLLEQSMIRRARLCGEEFKKLAIDILMHSRDMPADAVVACVEQFDKKAFKSNSLRAILPDAFQSSLKEEDDLLYDDGVSRITVEGLKEVVDKKEPKLKEIFSSEVVSSLKRNPVKAFKALPRPYKKIIATLD